jgi:hypothetical protein
MIQLSSYHRYFHTFHVVEREMISNNNNLSFCNIGGEYIQKGLTHCSWKAKL